LTQQPKPNPLKSTPHQSKKRKGNKKYQEVKAKKPKVFTSFKTKEEPRTNPKVILDPSSASNTQILDLYSEISKETVSRWKESLKYSNILTIRK
jgi:hypothetical protein